MFKQQFSSACFIRNFDFISLQNIFLQNHYFIQFFKISFILSYFMIEVLSLSELSSAIISTVYNLARFSKSDHHFIAEISQNCLNIFEFITSYYSDSSSHEFTSIDSSTNQKEHSSDQNMSTNFSSD